MIDQHEPINIEDLLKKVKNQAMAISMLNEMYAKLDDKINTLNTQVATLTSIVHDINSYILGEVQ